ncbi:DNA double-strand break repair ATPase Rad50 [Haloquadratum walsbyi]|uniref:DNA double-strand break repair Rad50 ATPase n=1 Tax=Haloquadratum walsbyi J07HQW2 TaxID=1238425 RepID=U1PWD3_9EURY|nr:DNA double-strand break repair ATPase Rad50 [Haloquadratum walsbyi]ERG96746.1 MAG: ATPase involved in DNA repair [Haloquadratum walsbyi J07HQW2]
MRFDHITLEHFKPYADASLDLRDGVTVIHGLNGSGKSSLLEACFFALYGARALDETLDDIVTTDEDDATIELSFSHAGSQYHIKRRLRRSGDRIQTVQCTLDGPDTEIDGATDVRAFITDILRMDAEAFVNCAYVRQGEVNKLINATPTQRQAIIDDLLQLGQLEMYRERASDARLGVEDILSEQRGAQTELETQIERKEDAGLHEQLNKYEAAKADLDSEIERFEENKARAEETRDNAKEILTSYKNTQEELSKLDSEIEDLQTTIEEDESTRSDLRNNVKTKTERVETLSSALTDALSSAEVTSADEESLRTRRSALEKKESSVRDSLRTTRQQRTMFENQAEKLTERVDDLESRADELRERVSEAETTITEAKERITAQRDTHSTITEQITAVRERFRNSPADLGDAMGYLETLQKDRDDIRDNLASARASLSTVQDRRDEAQTLQEAGKCPTCEQLVEGSPHVEAIDEYDTQIETLTDRITELEERQAKVNDKVETAESLVEAERQFETLKERKSLASERIEDARETVDEQTEIVTSLREDAEELDTEAEQKREAAATQMTNAETKAEEISAFESKLEKIGSARDRLDDLEEIQSKIENTKTEIERLRERREEIANRNDERREYLQAKRDRRAELAADVDESRIKKARDNREQATSYLEDVSKKLDELREERDTIQSQIGSVRGELENLAELREKYTAINERVNALEQLHEQVETLSSTYRELRADLRKQNVETLERMLNEVFNLVYDNDAYSRIQLDDAYKLTIFQKDETALNPEQLSGGERALFNLSLRCAIYRLLAEGIDGTAPMPPLILDEPTVFLDAGHVGRLVDLIEDMQRRGVAQILIVSHDKELIAAADHLVTVDKDPTSNRSSIKRIDDPQRTALSGASPNKTPQ